MKLSKQKLKQIIDNLPEHGSLIIEEPFGPMREVESIIGYDDGSNIACILKEMEER